MPPKIDISHFGSRGVEQQKSLYLAGFANRYAINVTQYAIIMQYAPFLRLVQMLIFAIKLKKCDCERDFLYICTALPKGGGEFINLTHK